MTIRAATPEDAEACASIYAPYVTGSTISFETDPPDAEEIRRRMGAAHAWLVAEEAEVVGFAYAGEHRSRAAYRWSCDVSIYLAPTARGGGVGRALYRALLDEMAARGYRMACAGVALPNPASEGLHRSLGFTEVGIYRDIGFKDGRWHDVQWWQLPLGDPGPPRGEPT